MKVACVQLTSGADMAANIARIGTMVAEAAGQGAQFVGLPENAFLMDEPGKRQPFYTAQEHPGIAASAEMARRHGIWLLVGSVAVRPPPVIPSVSEEAAAAGKDPSALPRDDKVKGVNRSLLFSPGGRMAAQYDKIHLFDVELPGGEVYAESARFQPGGQAALADLPGCRLGMTVCYDVRFPYLYRALAGAGANLLAVPSAFTQATGEAHWHVLLRARAIENGCFVIAPAQCGTHPGGRRTFGHSLIVGPWGEVVADAGPDEGIILAELDFARAAEVRTRLPSLRHDREFAAP